MTVRTRRELDKTVVTQVHANCTVLCTCPTGPTLRPAGHLGVPEKLKAVNYGNWRKDVTFRLVAR